MPCYNVMDRTGYDIKSMTIEELKALMEAAGEKPFRALQLFQWMHKEAVTSYNEMTNLSKKLRAELEAHYPLTHLTQRALQVSEEDGTRKYLFGLPDKECVETVCMRYHFGVSVCVSSQVGCKMGCKFCASTLKGCVRSLDASEMLEQVYAVMRDINERVSHVVVMGMGEPLDNLENVLRFIDLLTAPEGMNLSERAVTVSTCGLVREIRALAGEKRQINLAISLHAATQEKRAALMPVAHRYPLDELMDACAEYYDATHRQLTFEYALVKGENDTKEDAAALAARLKGLNCMVNLIPVNPVTETGLEPTNKTDVLIFRDRLEKMGIHVTIRREMGRDIDGACGQLRRRNV